MNTSVEWSSPHIRNQDMVSVGPVRGTRGTDRQAGVQSRLTRRIPAPGHPTSTAALSGPAACLHFRSRTTLEDSYGRGPLRYFDTLLSRRTAGTRTSAS